MSVWLFPVLFSLTECTVFRYNFADGSYFTGSVDTLGRPSQAEYYSHGVLKYNGSFLDGQYHGYGEYYDDDGQQYHGQFHRLVLVPRVGETFLTEKL